METPSMPPDASPTTATLPASKPPRRRKAKRPAAPVPTTPRKPRATVLARVAAMGPTHVVAYRTLAQGNPAFAAEVAAGFGANDAYVRATARDVAAQREARIARDELESARARVDASVVTFTKLDRLARDIATARGDVPDDDATDPAVAPTSAAE